MVCNFAYIYARLVVIIWLRTWAYCNRIIELLWSLVLSNFWRKMYLIPVDVFWLADGLIHDWTPNKYLKQFNPLMSSLRGIGAYDTSEPLSHSQNKIKMPLWQLTQSLTDIKIISIKTTWTGFQKGISLLSSLWFIIRIFLKYYKSILGYRSMPLGGDITDLHLHLPVL